MRANKFLHTLFKKSCPSIHASRMNALMTAVTSVLGGANLTLTSIGRNLSNTTSQKHRVKRIDQLLSNGHLLAEKNALYEVIANELIGEQRSIYVVVDWSPCPNKDNHMLRASMLTDDDSVVIYQEVHSEKKQCTHQVQKGFLKNLHSIIPDSVRVTLITDSGFRTNWFLDIVALGWDFIGRIRGNAYYNNGKCWVKCVDMHKNAREISMDLGDIYLSKATKFPCRLVMAKRRISTPKKCKRKKQKKNLKGTMEKKYRKTNSEPWLLATSLSKIEAKLIVKLYQKRMKIEGGFRNTKNGKFGLGLGYSLTRDRLRLTILVLIGAIATFFLWLIGKYTEIKNEHYKYQANTIKKRRVISLINLGLKVIKDRRTVAFSNLGVVIRSSHLQIDDDTLGNNDVINF